MSDENVDYFVSVLIPDELCVARLTMLGDVIESVSAYAVVTCVIMQQSWTAFGKHCLFLQELLWWPIDEQPNLEFLS